MRGLALWFMVLGVISALIGMSWGLYMAGTEDHTLAPAHGHLNLLGFVSFSVFAIYYHIVPGSDASALPKAHFLLSLVGLLALVPGIALALSGQSEILAVAGSMLSAVGMLCFLVVLLRGAHSR